MVTNLAQLYIQQEEADDPTLRGVGRKRMAALDPGIAWFGVAIYNAELVNGSVALELVDGACIHTAKSNKKRKVASADDDFQRARSVAAQLRGIFLQHDVGMLMAEERSFPRGATAIKSMAGAWGVIAALSDALGLPVVVVSPKRIKLKLCGREGASKQEVEDEVVRRFPVARGIADITIDAGKNNNHFFDACAAGIAGAQSDEALAWLRD